jgi:carbon storage regulator CsrA
MLSLSRRIGQCILIGDRIVVKVLDVLSADKIRIGVEAPPEIKVQRAERCEPPK